MANWNDLFSGGGGLIFPSTAAQGVNIALKSAASSSFLSNATGFWTAIDVSHTPLGYESVSLATATNTTEQEIIDLSGQGGVLTQILCPELSASGTVTVRITIDGVVTTITSPVLAFSAKRFCLGGFIISGTTITSGDGVGDGGALDGGYDSAPFTLMLTPIQSLKYNIGMPYKSSCKVTVQCSVAPESGDTGKSAACHTTTKLIGV